MRVGTCGALTESLTLGELLIAGDALVADGASQALGAGARVTAARSSSPRCKRPARRLRRDRGLDRLFYDPSGREPGWREAGASAVEMETAVLFTLAAMHGISAAAVLIVSDLLFPARRRIEAAALTEAEHRLGDLAAQALSELGLFGRPAWTELTWRWRRPPGSRPTAPRSR